jgi:hypothetical protein
MPIYIMVKKNPHANTANNMNILFLALDIADDE